MIIQLNIKLAAKPKYEGFIYTFAPQLHFLWVINYGKYMPKLPNFGLYFAWKPSRNGIYTWFLWKYGLVMGQYEGHHEGPSHYFVPEHHILLMFSTLMQVLLQSYRLWDLVIYFAKNRAETEFTWFLWKYGLLEGQYILNTSRESQPLFVSENHILLGCQF